MAEEVGSNLHLQALDISDKANPVISKFFSAPLENASNFIPHNPFVHEELLYVSHYNDGIQVFDVSDPYDPVRTAYYDTYPQNNGNGYNGYNGAWGVYPFLPSGCIAATDISNGFFTLKLEKYGIGSSVTEGYLHLAEAGAGIVINNSSGNYHKLTVQNDGTLITTPLIMPMGVSTELKQSQLVIGDGNGIILTSAEGSTYSVFYNGTSILTESIDISGLSLSTIDTGDLHINRNNAGIIFYNGLNCIKAYMDGVGSLASSPYTCPQE